MTDEQEREHYEPSGFEQIARAIKSLDGMEFSAGLALGAFAMFALTILFLVVILSSGDGELAGCRTVERRNTLHMEATPECLIIMKSIVEGEDK